MAVGSVLSLLAGGLAGAAPPRPAAAAVTISAVQTGTAASVGAGNVTLTLSVASTAGDLLVASLASDKVAAFTGPAGWVQGPNTGSAGGEAEIWYYPNNPGGITSAVFGNGATHFAGGQLTEWSGAAPASPLDATGTNVSSSAQSLAVTSTASTVAAGELGITAFVQRAGTTLTAGEGWSQSGTKGGGGYTYASDSRNLLPQTTVSETESSGKIGAFAGVVASFEPSSPAASAISAVQTGTAASVGAGNVTLALSVASTAGDLLVASLASDKVAAFTAPAGWVRGPNTGNAGGEAEIWYYPNNPGGITSAVFGNGAVHFAGGQLTEWSGAAPSSPLDVSGTNVSSSATSLAVTSSASTVVAGELGVSSFVQLAGAVFTAGTGWSQSGTKAGGGYTYASDTRNVLPQAAVSETEASNKSGAFAGVVASFEPVCSTGALTFSAPASVSFTGVVLNGQDQTTPGSAAGTVDDETNSGSGWDLQLTSTLFTDTGGRTLAATAATVTGGTASAGTGSCATPLNSIGYPIVVPAGSAPPTAVKVFNAAAASGIGPNTVTLALSLAVPANTYSGTYSSTWTFTIASGP